jgi:glucose/arabinose dehydrogenase
MRWNLFAASRPRNAHARRPRVELLEDRLVPATYPAGFGEGVVASGLAVPTAMDFAPDGRLFVTQQGGDIRVIKNGSLLAASFAHFTVDSTGERGLLGIAFDPNFTSNHYVYVYYTATTPTTHNRVSRITADPNGDNALFGSEVDLLDLPTLGATNHNGGGLHFGADGTLYVGVGENAVPSNSQSLGTPLGKMLRINPDGTIPADNPFFGQTTGINQAIWALGLRNPYTFAFQPGTGRLFINDVGQVTWEEIDDGIAGSNYGWPNSEGFRQPGDTPTTIGTYRDPLFEYGHGPGNTTGSAIVGGTFYNPPTATFPSNYVGTYFFQDLTNGWVRDYNPATGSVTGFATGLPANLVDLKVASDGSLYFLAEGSGGNTGVVSRVQYYPTVVIDDGQPGYSQSGAWLTAGGGYGGGISYAPAGQGEDTATWQATALPAGVYEVDTTWEFAYSNRASNAAYSVYDGNTLLATVRVDQRQAPAGLTVNDFPFQSLGTYQIGSGTLRVVETNAADNYVLADAVRIAPSPSPAGPPLAQPVVVDDGQVSYAESGTWQSAGGGYGGELRYAAAGHGEDTASWQVAGLPAGTYEVDATWTFYPSNRTSNAPYTIYDGATPVATVRVDQRQAPSGMTVNGFTFQSLGTFPISSGTLRVVLSNDADNYVLADAVRFAPVQLLVDDGQAGYSQSGTTWQTAGGGYGGGLHYAPAGQGEDTATWQFTGLLAGTYEVDATWTFAPNNRASNAPYSVYDGNTLLATVRVDQRQAPAGSVVNGFTFQSLGAYHITSGTLRVVLSNDADNYVLADAMRVAPA